MSVHSWFSHKLCMQLARNDPRIADLKLSFTTFLSDEHLNFLVEALVNNTNVKKLLLQNSHLGPRGVEIVSKLLRHNSTVRAVNLGRTEIYDQGAMTLASSLPLIRGLRVLILDRCNIGDAGVAAIAHGLEKNSTVERINLRENRIGNGGAKAIGRTLKINKHIQHLSLANNRITDPGIQHICTGLERNKSVQHIDLSGNAFRDQGVVAIGQMLKMNRCLKELYMYYTYFGEKGREALLEGMKYNYCIEQCKLLPDIQKELDYYVDLNAVGHRHILRGGRCPTTETESSSTMRVTSIPDALFAHIFAKFCQPSALDARSDRVKKDTQSAGILYHYIRENPHLFRIDHNKMTSKLDNLCTNEMNQSAKRCREKPNHSSCPREARSSKTFSFRGMTKRQRTDERSQQQWYLNDG